MTVPANPGAQIVQAETDALPAAEPVVYMPVGHAVAEAFTVPGLETAPKKPGAAIVHDATDPWPVADPVVVVLIGHGVQNPAPAEAYVPEGQRAHAEGNSPPAHAHVPSAALRAMTAVGAA